MKTKLTEEHLDKVMGFYSKDFLKQIKYKSKKFMYKMKNLSIFFAYLYVIIATFFFIASTIAKKDSEFIFIIGILFLIMSRLEIKDIEK